MIGANQLITLSSSALTRVILIRNQHTDEQVAPFVFVITLRPRQNGRQIPENIWISLNISLKFVPKSLIENMAALVQIMACRRPSDKPLSEPMMVNLLTHTSMRHSASMS